MLTERVNRVIHSRKMEMDISNLMCAASLAHHGLLGSRISALGLCDVDVSPVPPQHLASLTSCVKADLHIINVSGCDLVSILSSVNCHILDIRSQNLGKEETQALVQAMESSVAWVELSGEVNLSEYSGQGVCRYMRLWGDPAARYKEEMKTWARSRNWSEGYCEDVENLLVLMY